MNNKCRYEKWCRELRASYNHNILTTWRITLIIQRKLLKLLLLLLYGSRFAPLKQREPILSCAWLLTTVTYLYQGEIQQSSIHRKGLWDFVEVRTFVSANWSHQKNSLCANKMTVLPVTSTTNITTKWLHKLHYKHNFICTSLPNVWEKKIPLQLREQVLHRALSLCSGQH